MPETQHSNKQKVLPSKAKAYRFTFNKPHFIGAVVLFFIEGLIALFFKDRFIRPYVGDYLVVMLMYCAIRSFLHAPAYTVPFFVLLVAYVIEALQYFQLVTRLGMDQNIWIKTIIGYGFDWKDIVAYTLGAGTLVGFEFLRRKLYGAKQID